jgi:hypothetical protein
MIKTKNDCVHKFDGRSLIQVNEQISNNKFICKCTSCQQIFEFRKKHIPVDAQWNVGKEE